MVLHSVLIVSMNNQQHAYIFLASCSGTCMFTMCFCFYPIHNIYNTCVLFGFCSWLSLNYNWLLNDSNQNSIKHIGNILWWLRVFWITMCLGIFNSKLPEHIDTLRVWLMILDLQCIFCKILHETNVVNQALQNHPDTVNHISKNLPIPGHERGLQWSEAMLFTGTIAWSEKYYELRDKLFWTPLNIASIKKSIDSIWMDSQTATRVLESKRFVNRVKDETNECYQIFSQHSVPATVILNNKTGKYIKLESHWWKIPLESIEKSIKKLW